jgi:uncharacterized protein YndB with AHSA1/START domain
MASIVGRASVVIDRSAADVWDWIADPSNMHLWVKEVDDPGSWIIDGAPTVGSRYSIDYKYARNTNEIVFEVVEAVPGKRFIVDTVEGPYPILVEYTFEPENDGKSTKLSIKMNARSDEFFNTILFMLTGWFAKRFMDRRLVSELQQVKIELEK